MPRNKLRPAATVRRIMVSNRGIAHHPMCQLVPLYAELQLWGEILNVGAALRLLRDGEHTPSRSVRGHPGPTARPLCHCLDEIAA